MDFREPLDLTVNRSLLVDGHVHIYAAYDLARFFASAQQNLANAARARGLADGSWEGALLLTEMGNDYVFEALVGGSVRPPAVLQMTAMQEDCVLRFEEPGRAPLYVIAGRQIAASNGVEVLTLATRSVVPDRLPLGETLDRAEATGGLVVIPWGFGKWTLARGEAVRREVEARGGARIALGDNGGRLSLAPRPSLFSYAEERRMLVLPGSDPFPFAGHEDRVGSYGFVLPDWQGSAAPAKRIADTLRAMSASPEVFGRLTGPASFAISQVRMQVRSRIAKLA